VRDRKAVPAAFNMHWRHRFGSSTHLWQASRQHEARRQHAPLLARSVEAPAEYRPAAAIAALRTRYPRHAKVASAGVGRTVPVAVEGPRTVVFRGRARRAPSNPSLERRPPTAWRLGRGTAKAYHQFRGPSATPLGAPQLER